MLHPELVAGVSGMTHAHSLRVEDVNLEEVAGCSLLKPVIFPSALHFAQFHQSSSFINLGGSHCNTIHVAHNTYSSDDIQ